MLKYIQSNKLYYILSLLSIVLATLVYMYIGKENIFLAVNHFRFRFLDIIMPYATFVGDGWFAAIVVIFCSILPGQKQLTLFVSWIFVFLLVTVLKNYIFMDMHRPMSYFYERNYLVQRLSGMEIHTSHSFPSGHTASAFAVLGILAGFTSSNIYKCIYFLLAVLVGWSRVYLGQHFVEDIIVGAFLGIVSAYFGQWIFRKMEPKPSLLALANQWISKL